MFLFGSSLQTFVYICTKTLFTLSKMILARVVNQSKEILRNSSRCYCYKTVKRPKFNDKPKPGQKKHLEEKLSNQSEELAKHIRARIEFGGPITGKVSI